jgi:hypothetical protein
MITAVIGYDCFLIGGGIDSKQVILEPMILEAM